MDKYIILLDREGILLDYILKYTDYHIATLVCETNQQTQGLLADYSDKIAHILNYQNLLEIKHCTHIDYDLIKKMKDIQIDVETMLHRVMLNNPIAKDIYYQYLSFFAEVFEKYRIAFVLNAEMILATPHHLIPFGLARLYHIPSYTLESINGNASLFFYNTRTTIAYEISSKPKSYIKEQCFYHYDTHTHKQKRNLKTKIASILYKIGGAILVEFAECLLKRSFKRNFMGLEYNYFSKLYSLFKHKQMHRFYKKYAQVPNLNEKFIYFNIHLEPEAAIIGRASLEAQLTLVKMTANALPKGWKLYVKEHPHQLLMNDNLTNYFLHNITFFKNIAFYKSIMEVPNTTLVSLKINSKELIAKSQAIATFNGTVCIEALGYKKPIIMFDSLSSPYQCLSHTLHIFSYKDLQDAMKKIKSGFPLELDEKKEFEILEAYMADENNPAFFPCLISTIESHNQDFKALSNIS